MVEVQLGAREALAAVLASIIVAREDVEAREAHMTLRHTLIGHQQQHARYADVSAHDSEALMMHLNRQVAPALEIEGAILLVDGLGDTLIEERKGALHRSDVNRQVGAIQNQDPAVQKSPALAV